MSTAQLGNSRVDAVGRELSKCGYTIGFLKASGRRGQRRRDLNCLAGDLLALAPEGGGAHLIVEVGGVGKRLSRAFAELNANPMPGFCPIVVRFVNRKQRIYVDGQATWWTSWQELANYLRYQANCRRAA